MEFTEEQYDKAIQALKDAKKVFDKDYKGGCPVCGGDCLPHQCGHNPLYAMKMCEEISEASEELHHKLHVLSGVHTYMGEPIGPNAIKVPKKD